MKIKIDDLAKTVEKELELYRAEIDADTKDEVKKQAKEAVSELKKTSPVGRGTRKGHYSAGWTSSVTGETPATLEVTVHNKNKPGLTHLLENGHAKRGGGRVQGIPHIRPVEEKVRADFERTLKGRLSG